MMNSLIDTGALTLNTQPVATPKTEKAAKEFEAMFVSEMLNHMFEGVGTDPIFGGGHGEEMFRSLMVREYGQKMTEGHGIGIADQMKRMLIQMQGEAS